MKGSKINGAISLFAGLSQYFKGHLQFITVTDLLKRDIVSEILYFILQRYRGAI